MVWNWSQASGGTRQKRSVYSETEVGRQAGKGEPERKRIWRKGVKAGACWETLAPQAASGGGEKAPETENFTAGALNGSSTRTLTPPGQWPEWSGKKRAGPPSQDGGCRASGEEPLRGCQWQWRQRNFSVTTPSPLPLSLLSSSPPPAPSPGRRENPGCRELPHTAGARNTFYSAPQRMLTTPISPHHVAGSFQSILPVLTLVRTPCVYFSAS